MNGSIPASIVTFWAVSYLAELTEKFAGNAPVTVNKLARAVTIVDAFIAKCDCSSSIDGITA